MLVTLKRNRENADVLISTSERDSMDKASPGRTARRHDNKYQVFVLSVCFLPARGTASRACMHENLRHRVAYGRFVASHIQ